MDDLGVSLLVIAATAVVVGLIFWLVARQKQQRETALKNLASMNGWVYEPVKEQYASGYRLRKGEWQIEGLNVSTRNPSDDSGSSTVTSHTRWFSPRSNLPQGIIMIGPRQPEIDFGGIGGFLQQAALQLMIGKDAENARGIERVELGSLELMKRYMVWTNQAEAAKRLLDQPLENALMNWPPKKTLPVIKISPAGLEIKIQGERIYQEADLIALVKLGTMLLDSAR